MVAFMLQPRSNGTFMRQSAVRLPVLLILYASLWLAAEVAAFSFVVRSIGFVGAILACILTSLAGLAMLRRLGVSAALRLRQAVVKKGQDQGVLSKEAMLDGTLSGLGAVLLIIPGFVSDLMGLALAAPSIRLWVSERLNAGKAGRTPNGRPAAPKMIELTPKEWSRRDGQEPGAGPRPVP